MSLESINEHPRDRLIEFDEPSHTYTINGDTDYMSATTFVHSNFPVFDEEQIITNMMSSSKWQKNKYYPMTRQQIKQEWEKTRNEAADKGTIMHAQIEDYYNEKYTFDTLPETLEMTAFKTWHNDFMIEQNLNPYRTEWRVFHEELRIAGTIDMTYVDSNGNIYIVDWKRCREIKKFVNERFPPKACLNPGLTTYYDTNYFHYSVQLNLYKHILETKYDKTVKELALVNLHPEKRSSVEKSSYEYFDVPFMNKDQIDSLYTWRQAIKDKKA